MVKLPTESSVRPETCHSRRHWRHCQGIKSASPSACNSTKKLAFWCPGQCLWMLLIWPAQEHSEMDQTQNSILSDYKANGKSVLAPRMSACDECCAGAGPELRRNMCRCWMGQFFPPFYLQREGREKARIFPALPSPLGKLQCIVWRNPIGTINRCSSLTVCNNLQNKNRTIAFPPWGGRAWW